MSVAVTFRRLFHQTAISFLKIAQIVRKKEALISVISMYVFLVRHCATSQHDRCQDDQAQRVGSQDQHVASDTQCVQVETVKGMLLQYNSVVHGENLRNCLKQRHTKRDRPERPAQKEEWQARSKGERNERLAL